MSDEAGWSITEPDLVSMECRKGFETLVAWVRKEFDGLEQHAQQMRFVN
jgi:hypothetical protein